MTDSIKDKAMEAGHTLVGAAKTVGHTLAEGTEKAAGWIKEKTAPEGGKSACDPAKMAASSAILPGNVHKDMEVIASCGKHVGVVDHVVDNMVKLTKSDPTAMGVHHFIPLDWVARVDQHVHLNKNSEEVFRDWKAESVGSGI